MSGKISNNAFVVIITEFDSDNAERYITKTIFSGGMCRGIVKCFICFMFKINIWLSSLDFILTASNKTFDFNIKFGCIRIFIRKGRKHRFTRSIIFCSHNEAHIFSLKLYD